MSGPIAVVGATGRQGGAVARHLLKHGTDVLALLRDPDGQSAHRLREAGADTVRADLSDADSLASAFRGTAAVFAMTTYNADGAEAEVRQGAAIADAVVAAEVPSVVYSSVGGADRATGIPHFESKWAIEQRLRTTGVPLTVIRPVFFMENLMRAGVVTDEADGQVFRYAFAPGVPVQMIASDDIGAIAARAVLDPSAIPGGQLEIAGDELTPEQMAAAFAEASGRPTRFEPTPIDAVPDADRRAMYTWLATTPGYQADFATSAALRPGIRSFPAFLSGATP
ncbi:NmrA/HSCARG family protein [Amycolatopsis sp. Hca4]|uniref:NmrA/HSCARG family protein n=1 Tax=Amycolatopsis sp. Hca4 TaxID=2742131 RepID=UPI0015919C57|nr:NmrA/HSCARG family protein [Amycolatopsis sp. Hca4]QKV80759.1 NmrA/HSCARG family protein [Amycolatopsis sp. Hca4]